MSAEKNSRYVGLGLLAWGGGTIFNLVLFRFIAYEPLRLALNVSHAQYGLMMSVFSAAGMVSYFPGGWLADRFSARKLLTLAYASTGLAGLYFATFPSYVICLLIHAFWGVSTSLIFWAAMLKSCKDMAGQDEQGRFFGLLEGGRGVVSTVTGFAAVGVLGLAQGQDPLSGLRWALFLQAGFTLSAAVLTWIMFKDQAGTKTQASVGSDTMATIRNPLVWAASGMVFACCGAKACLTYVNPYLTGIFAMSAALAGSLSIVWTYGAQFVGAPISGFIADRVGHRPKVLFLLFVIVAIFFIPLAVMPADPALLAVLLVTATGCFLTIYAIRGLYFAVVGDLDIPAAISGSAIGLISMVGFTPDIFVYPLAGHIIDLHHSSAEGYKIVFGLATGFSVFGAVLGGLVTMIVSRRRKARGAAS